DQGNPEDPIKPSKPVDHESGAGFLGIDFGDTFGSPSVNTQSWVPPSTDDTPENNQAADDFTIPWGDLNSAQQQIRDYDRWRADNFPGGGE
ncbi:hypothetical protein LCGC14_0303600, partial [marine sediment metagenome]